MLSPHERWELEKPAGQGPSVYADLLSLRYPAYKDRIAKARAEAGLGEMPDATQTDELGSRGGRVDGVPVHAVRLRGLTASEEILLGNAGEQLVIRTDSFDRVSFMPGVLLGVRRVIGRTGLTIGLDQVMGL